jgi:arabinofuranosyltransferase
LAASRDGLWVGAALVALAAAIITTAWVCDDAYITFRTVDNFTSGEGLRWNVAERVQSYTHPLWMFAISALYLVGGDVYYTSLLLSFVCSMTAVAILAFRVAGSPRMALLGLAPLLFSRAFVDYSTSGLENPLTHLLLAMFFWRCAEPESGEGDDATRAMRLGLLAGLIGLNRLDALLLVTPAIAVFLATNERWRARTVVGRIALGAAPLFAWELFSLFYYGFPFPNTAYAKLTTGVSEAALALQGLRYFSDSLSRDPLTLIATLAGVASAIWVGGAIATPQRNRRRAMAGGIALHLLYVVWIGGDFMSGRLFTSPLFCAALLICETRTVSRGSFAAAIAAVVALALIAGVPTLTSGPDYGSAASRASQESEHGIGDERAVYYPDTGLVRRWLGLARVEDHPWALDGKAARDFGLDWARGQALGLYGFYAGPQMHILDMVGLSDPLLARIDARRAWRIGHFEREIPLGYIATLRSGSNRIADPELAAYYDALMRVVRDPLFDAARLGVILRINLGALDAGLDGYRRESSQ